jgi:hypothetical protein
VEDCLQPTPSRRRSLSVHSRRPWQPRSLARRPRDLRTIAGLSQATLAQPEFGVKKATVGSPDVVYERRSEGR